MTWPVAVAVLGWRLAPDPGTCQVVEGALRCQAESRHLVGASTRPRDVAWICSRHYGEAAKLVNGRLKG